MADDRDAVPTMPGKLLTDASTQRSAAADDVPGSTGLQLPAEGYALGEVIGRGGMGEVVAAHDLRIGRDVALKRMHDNMSPTAVSRFLREARIQARLDHPAIVPVHELGTDALGRPFFTMKRLAGVTLAERLTATEPTQPLLRAFVEVCLAIDLAHSRGIVHRDLKPANIMLGDYGEVYVIDWGLARVVGERTEPEDGEPREPLDTADGMTRAGAILGTPGYMPPEQVRGEVVGAPADIYALGAILFEILTRDPLHPQGKEALVSTLTSPSESPSRRAPDRSIAPELDDACRACLAEEPAERPTARELADRLRRYVDGDRDVERRRALATEHLASAHAALASATPDARATALRHAGRALALDPESTAVAGLVTRLLVERPTELPPELVANLAELDRESLRKRSRRAAISYATVFAFLGLLPVLRVESWPWLVGFYAVLGGMVAFAWRNVYTGNVTPRLAMLSMLGNLALALVFTRIAGPFMLTPVMICGALLAVASHPWNQQRPWTLFAWISVTVLTPILLEALGILAQTWRIEDGAIVTTSTIYGIYGSIEAGALVVANLAFMLLVGAFAFTVTRTARDAQRDLHIQAWHLRHLVPEVAGSQQMVAVPAR
jgi:serine/threonine-protein kinase